MMKNSSLGNNISWKCERLKKIKLTDYIQVYRITFNWLRRNLTVVAADVPLLNPFDLQRPFVGRPVMGCLKAKVSRVSVCADG